MKKLLYITIGLLSFASCEKSDLSTDQNSANLPVVEAYLASGQPVTLHIERQAPFETTDSLALPIEGLRPIISWNDEDYLLEETTPGTYGSGPNLIIQSDQSYGLSFEYEGLEVSAQTLIPSRPAAFRASDSQLHFDTDNFPPSFPDPIQLDWENPENDYYQVGVQYAERDTVAIDFFGGNGDGEDNEGRPQFASNPQQSNSYELGFQDFQYVGTHRVVLFHVTAEYVTLSQDASSDNTQNLTTPYTNISNGLGIFTGVGTDTIIVEITN
ncbi:MAG: DUF4249 family protein [Bacteroidota bacterium]